MKLLCLSNGHGEDAIAVQVLQALLDLAPQTEVAALPLVGQGQAYQRAGIAIAGPTQTLPSGGFIYMDLRQWWRDARGGLLGLTWAQIQAVRAWRRAAGESGRLLAVGDIVPLLFAFAAGQDAPYAFIGTAKSEYYLRDEAGQFLRSRRLEGWSGSVYLPWERWLMGRSRCRAIFPRDELTARILADCLAVYGAGDIATPGLRHRVLACGNPMMDGLVVGDRPALPLAEDRPPTVLLLPGSRSPEALANWQRILAVVAALLAAEDRDQSWRFLAAIAPGIPPEAVAETLQAAGWQSGSGAWRLGPATLEIAADFARAAAAADWAIATAGTATEQVVGLGKPAMAIAGTGPQFTPAFAEAQTRLLGCSLTLLDRPSDAPEVWRRWRGDRALWQAMAENGRRRLGPPGAARRIAQGLIDRLAV